jgi:hypothetical protein
MNGQATRDDFRNAPQVRVARFYLRWVMLPAAAGIASAVIIQSNFFEAQQRSGLLGFILAALPGTILTVIALRTFRNSQAKSREEFRRYLNRKR